MPDEVLSMGDLIFLAAATILVWVCVRQWRKNTKEEISRKIDARRSADTTALIGHPRVYGYGVPLFDTPEAREFVRKALVLAGNSAEDADRLANEIPLHGRTNP